MTIYMLSLTLSDTLLSLFALTFTFRLISTCMDLKREGLNAFHPDELEERKQDSFFASCVYEVAVG